MSSVNSKNDDQQIRIVTPQVGDVDHVSSMDITRTTWTFLIATAMGGYCMVAKCHLFTIDVGDGDYVYHT